MRSPPTTTRTRPVRTHSRPRAEAGRGWSALVIVASVLPRPRSLSAPGGREDPRPPIARQQAYKPSRRCASSKRAASGHTSCRTSENAVLAKFAFWAFSEVLLLSAPSSAIVGIALDVRCGLLGGDPTL